jgi:hypothetical protein
MVIKLLALSIFLFTSCGNDIQLKNNKLENISAARSAASYEKTGTLKKGTPSTVLTQGQTYTVSNYSSRQASAFITTLPESAQIPVIYTGGIQGHTIVLEAVRRQ